MKAQSLPILITSQTIFLPPIKKNDQVKDLIIGFAPLDRDFSPKSLFF